MTTSELDTLFPASQQLEIAGQRLHIGPLVIGELPAMLKAVRPFASQLSAQPDWLTLLSEHGDALLAALALGSRQPRDWIDALAIDDAMTVATAVFEVNAGFFVHRVAPKLSALVQGLSGRMAGATPSPA